MPNRRLTLQELLPDHQSLHVIPAQVSVTLWELHAQGIRHAGDKIPIARNCGDIENPAIRPAGLSKFLYVLVVYLARTKRYLLRVFEHRHVPLLQAGAAKIARNPHDQVVIAAHLFTEKLSVGDRSIAAFKKRPDQDGDHLLALDAEAGAAKLNCARKDVLRL